MRNTVLFGNGINRLSADSISWDELLDENKSTTPFKNGALPYTMVYERIFMEQHLENDSQKVDELRIKEKIAKALKLQKSNDIYNLMANMDFDSYLTTNYDYAFEKALDCEPKELSTEILYSLRRKRRYKTSMGDKYLWNIHGEIDHPKSIMLGFDHYCGSVSKIESYVKGKYSHTKNGKSISVEPMVKKLQNKSFCNTSWVDLFFNSNIHIIGLSLDYSETDIWWLLNKRARYFTDGLIKNKVYFYSKEMEDEKVGLLKSFNVEVVQTELSDNSYANMYENALEKISFK